MLTRLPDFLHVVPSTSQDMKTISKTGSMIDVGLPKLKILRQNLPVGSVPLRANRVRDKAT
jgi:hypothetical protein